MEISRASLLWLSLILSDFALGNPSLVSVSKYFLPTFLSFLTTWQVFSIWLPNSANHFWNCLFEAMHIVQAKFTSKWQLRKLIISLSALWLEKIQVGIRLHQKYINDNQENPIQKTRTTGQLGQASSNHWMLESFEFRQSVDLCNEHVFEDCDLSFPATMLSFPSSL